MAVKVRTGLDLIVEQEMALLRGKQVGLVTNHSAVNRNLVHAVEVLRSADVTIKALFGPEHGIRGDMPEGRAVPSSTDVRTGIPVFSLYGSARKPTREMLAGINLMLLDIQDVGCRCYTYIYTMAYVMQACAEMGLEFVVLDRPNPVNGVTVEGNVLNPKFASFAGLYPLAMRHGMTIGELAAFLNGQFGIGAEVRIVMCQGWKRAMWFDETGLPWVMPSPNMPTPETAILYPGLCLLEGTNVSEGRGTTKPFELIGAPWIDANELADDLNSLNLPGVRFRPAYFIPWTSKYKGEKCAGVQVHVTDRDALKPTEVGLHIIKTLYDKYTKEFQFLKVANSDKYYFDMLMGTDATRHAIEVRVPADEIIDSWYEEIAGFVRDRKPYLQYL